MPELPEVQTTVDGLNRTVKGKKIVGVTSTYTSKFFAGKDEIKNPQFFRKFKKTIVGQKILRAERRAKNILLHLSGGQTILVHMKMTGHFVYNREIPFVRLDFVLNNDKHLYLSDMRKFAKVTLIETKKLDESSHLSKLGPEPLDRNFQFSVFNSQLKKRAGGKIKQVLMDPKIVAGIGNIYADEILWHASVHPLSRAGKIPEKNLRLMYDAIKKVLKRSIGFGGDSMSDYRNIRGEKGGFQEYHQAYQRHGKKCLKKGCSGILKRIKIGTRSAHFCPKHQKLFK